MQIVAHACEEAAAKAPASAGEPQVRVIVNDEPLGLVPAGVWQRAWAELEALLGDSITVDDEPAGARDEAITKPPPPPSTSAGTEDRSEAITMPPPSKSTSWMELEEDAITRRPPGGGVSAPWWPDEEALTRRPPESDRWAGIEDEEDAITRRPPPTAAPRAEVDATRSAEALVSGHRTRPRRALVAVHAAVLRSELMSLLYQAGFEAIAVADGARGVAQLSSHRPHVVIADFELPRLAGDLLLEKARAVRGEELRAAVLIGAELPDVLLPPCEAADVVLGQPFDAARVIELLLVHLRDADDEVEAG